MLALLSILTVLVLVLLSVLAILVSILIAILVVLLLVSILVAILTILTLSWYLSRRRCARLVHILSWCLIIARQPGSL